jgi:DNA-binding XRE family transcriptional regulator
MNQIASPKIHAQYRSAQCVNGTVKAALIAPLYVCMISGTGGVYTPTNIQFGLSLHSNPVVEIRGYHTKRNQLLSVSQQLVGLREMFGLTMTELAQILGVTRPTVYAWLNGSEPKPEIKFRILGLAKYVEELRNVGISQAETLARQPQSDGQSLISLLKSGADPKSAIATIKYSASHTSGLKAVKRDFGPTHKTRRVSLDEISIPIRDETGDAV